MILKNTTVMNKAIPFLLVSLLWSLAVLPQKKGGFKMITAKPAAQKPKKPAPPPLAKSWFITYEMSVKGEGTMKDNPGEEGETTWSIDRKYVGVTELNFRSPGYLPTMTPEEVIACLRAGTITNWSHMTAENGGSFALEHVTLPSHIIIKDKLKTLVKDRGEGASFENTTTETEWNADCDVRTINDLRLQIDKRLPSYNVWIHVAPFYYNLEEPSVRESTVKSYE